MKARVYVRSNERIGALAATPPFAVALCFGLRLRVRVRVSERERKTFTLSQTAEVISRIHVALCE